MSILTTLYARWRRLVHELAKFGVIGAIATVIDFGIADYLHGFAHWPGIDAKVVSVAVAATFAYFGNRHWTFRHRARSGLRREYTLFFVLNGVGLAIAAACIWLVQDVLHKPGLLWYNLAQAVGLLIGTIFRFTTYKRWVFLKPRPAAIHALADGSIAEASIQPDAQATRTRSPAGRSLLVRGGPHDR